jgi:hypothetical protein
MDLYAATSASTKAIATRPARVRLVTVAPGEGGAVIGLKAGKGRIEHFSARHEDDIQTRRRFLLTEQLTGETLGPVPHNRGAEFSSGGHAKPAPVAAVWRHEQGHEPAGQPQAVLVCPLEFRSPPDAILPGKALRHRALARYRSSETVRRFLPFVRRRFSTMRPFFVDIRTRKPCVLLRRRVLG